MVYNILSTIMVNTLEYSTDLALLTPREMAVYRAALAKPGISATELSDLANVPRTSVYHTLNSLTDKGLISEEKLPSGRTMFQAADPKVLVKKARRATKQALENEKQIKALVKELDKLVGSGTDQAVVKVASGTEGAWALIEDVLQSRKDSYWLTATQLPFQKLVSETEYFRRITHRRKRMKHTVSYIVADVSDFSSKISRQADTDFRLVKLLPASINLKSTIIAYGNKIGMISYGKNLQTVIIENKLMAEIIKIFYNLVWQNL